MSAAVHRSTPSLSVPQTRNTAPVLEFNCLYTHDLRRKQKRWQDGFLRYHTFNKRIMVYDVPRNFIGDMHWKEEAALQEGDEITLDKGGALVQVADSIGRTETDLTELLGSVKKATSHSHISSSPTRSVTGPTRVPPPGGPQRLPSQAKHKSLNVLLGTPRGPLGKATLPVKSPFESRNAGLENLEWEVGRPPKRPRIQKARSPGVEQSSAQINTANGAELPSWARTADSAKHKPKAPPVQQRQQQRAREVIEIDDDEPPEERFLQGFFSDDLQRPSSPPAHVTPARARPFTDSSSPGFQTMVKSRRVPDRSAVTATKQSAPLGHVVDTRRRKMSEHPTRADEDNVGSGPTLRFGTTAPRKKMLLCQVQVSQNARRSKSLERNAHFAGQPSPPAETGTKLKTPREKLDERLARINNKVPKNKTTRSTRSPSPGQPVSELQEAIDILAHRADRSSSPTQNQLSPTACSVSDRHSVSANNHLPENTEQSESAVPPPAMAIPSPVQRSIRAPRPSLRATSNPLNERDPALGLSKPDTPGRAPEPAPVEPEPQPQKQQFKPRLKKTMQRAVSLNTATHGTSTVILSKPFRAPAPPNFSNEASAAVPAAAPDAWSREAFDLFDWRPPGWDEEGWCVKKDAGNEG